MEAVKTIGVLTSGGDAPGMNAAIRAVVRTAIYHGVRVMGIKHGYNGLISGDLSEMHLRDVSGIIHRGGTILYTARCKEFMMPQGVEAAAKTCKDFGIDALVVIGGDGSFRGAQSLFSYGVSCVGIPGTIDNDIACSEYTIGYDTAMNTAMEMIDKLRDTAQSHDRCSVVEVMGRNAGYIAVNTGIAVGAIATLIPEIPYDLENDILPRMMNTKQTGKQHFIILVAEGVGKATEIAQFIRERTGIEARATVLGHVQRGGSPSLQDRVVASQMGYHAVCLLCAGAKGRIVAMHDHNIVDYDIEEALAMEKTVDPELMKMSQIISI